VGVGMWREREIHTHTHTYTHTHTHTRRERETYREGLLVGANLDVAVVLHVLVILDQNLPLDLRGGHRLIPSPTKPTNTHRTEGAAVPIPTQILLLGMLDLAVIVCVCVYVCVYMCE
jgi:hypothetical protein